MYNQEILDIFYRCLASFIDDKGLSILFSREQLEQQAENAYDRWISILQTVGLEKIEDDKVKISGLSDILMNNIINLTVKESVIMAKQFLRELGCLD